MKHLTLPSIPITPPKKIGSEVKSLINSTNEPIDFHTAPYLRIGRLLDMDRDGVLDFVADPSEAHFFGAG